MLKVHGTYPFDEHDANWNPAWRRIRFLKPEEAAKLLKYVGTEPLVNVFLNKGFIVLNLEKTTGDDGISPIQAAVGEMMGGALTPNIEPGMNAIYNHDGQFSLIKRILPRDHSQPSIH